jgi:predicted amidohydrolase
VYSAGSATPVFTIGALTLGIIICRDSTFPEPARRMVEQGASVVFIPTNNGLPRGRASASVTEDARHCDVAIAVTHRIPVIRADVAGEWNGRVAHGSSEIVDAGGMVLAAGQPSRPGLLVASIC